MIYKPNMKGEIVFPMECGPCDTTQEQWEVDSKCNLYRDGDIV